MYVIPLLYHTSSAHSTPASACVSGHVHSLLSPLSYEDFSAAEKCQIPSDLVVKCQASDIAALFFSVGQAINRSVYTEIKG